MTERRPRVGLIGLGPIGLRVAGLIGRRGSLAAVLTRSEHAPLAGVLMARSPDEFLASRPDVVIECAGQDALERLGRAILASGADLVPSAVGALADPTLLLDLLATARSGGSRIRIPSGAVAGLDALAAAKAAGELSDVSYIQVAPASAWRPTPRGVSDANGRQLVFSGTAREAARRFPHNANVVAAVALAGIGFERTAVELYADAGADRTEHEIRDRAHYDADPQERERPTGGRRAGVGARRGEPHLLRVGFRRADVHDGTARVTARSPA